MLAYLLGGPHHGTELIRSNQTESPIWLEAPDGSLHRYRPRVIRMNRTRQGGHIETLFCHESLSEDQCQEMITEFLKGSDFQISRPGWL